MDPDDTGAPTSIIPQAPFPDTHSNLNAEEQRRFSESMSEKRGRFLSPSDKLLESRVRRIELENSLFFARLSEINWEQSEELKVILANQSLQLSALQREKSLNESEQEKREHERQIADFRVNARSLIRDFLGDDLFEFLELTERSRIHQSRVDGIVRQMNSRGIPIDSPVEESILLAYTEATSIASARGSELRRINGTGPQTEAEKNAHKEMVAEFQRSEILRGMSQILNDEQLETFLQIMVENEP